MNSITSFNKRFPQAIFWAIAWPTFFFGYFMYVRTSSDIWQFLILGPFVGGILVTGIADGRSVDEYDLASLPWFQSCNRVHAPWLTALL